LRAAIDPRRAGPGVPPDGPEHRHTVYLCVVDRDGNAISFINSIFDLFGSTRMAPRSGVMLQNRGQSFRMDPGHPNVIAPRKRPLHTIIPGMLVKDGRAVMPFGVMGGQYQAVGHADLVTGILDLGLDPQAAMDRPRSFANAGILKMEATHDPAVVEELRRRGHDVTVTDDPLGGSQAIWIDHARGVLVGGSDPRKDGCAMGY
jgi:gamma-glutamyltranspeptidase/glutathione hydrolase